MYYAKLNSLALLGLILISGCSPKATPLDNAVVINTIEDDRTKIYQPPQPEQQPLKVEEVLARAIKHNLDAKVSELDALIAADDVNLQMLNALPSINAKIQRQGRNNEGGSSSFSVLTNTESLQPSISQEQYRNVAQLTTEWNLLDTGINLWRGKTALDQMLIAQERRRKIYQGVVQDSYIAFWRAAVAQQTLPNIDSLIDKIDERLEKDEQQTAQGLVSLGDAQSRKTQLLDQKAQLNRLKNGLSLAQIELKTLIAYPLDQELILDLENQDPLGSASLPSITASIEDYELKALTSRPEIREEILNKRISTRDIKLSIVETIPGAELLLTGNYDSNKFLVYNNWVDGIAGLTASINKIFTAPTRYKKAKNIDALSDQRRQALVAAIITQVHVAASRYNTLENAYQEQTKSVGHAQKILKRATDYKDVGLMSKAELLNTEVDYNIANINRAFAFADAQDAYGRFINTLGIDLWDENNPDLSIENYANQIRKNLDASNLVKTTATRNELAES
ncbi:MAG: TolC family protein [Alphaproteobacteria bacterium]